MKLSNPHTILTATDGPAAGVINPTGTSPICLVCEHASSSIPRSLGNLGLKDADRLSHAVWDIGAYDLAVALSQAFDAPLVVSRVSRLVYDCNRDPAAPDAIPEKTERIDIPGNKGLNDAQRAARVDEVYRPFEALLQHTLAQFSKPPVLVTIHSFTPVWLGVSREVDLGLLHDTDDRFATSLLTHAPKDIDTRLNAPYSARDGVTHTLRQHALPLGLQNVMIEVRNDLISDKAGVGRFKDILANMISAALTERVMS